MIGIFKKEIRSYRTTMPAYVFAAFILAVIGLYFSYNNLNLASPGFESVLKSVHFLFIVFVPFLTMRIMAEERRQKTDQLLLTLPLRPWEIVCGKYAAAVLIYAIPMLIVCFYPLILMQYGQINGAVAWFSVLGFFLLGCAYLSIGLFCSSLTESPVIAAVMSFGALLFTYILDTAAKMIPYSSRGSAIAFGVLLFLAALVIYALVHHVGICLVFFAAGSAVLGLLYYLQRPVLEGSFQKFLSVFYLNGRMDGFYEGLLDIPALVYYLCVIVLALFLTCQVVGRRGICDVKKKPYGIYSAAMTVILVVGMVLVNRILENLPGAVIRPDLSTAGLYTLTPETESFLEGLDRDVKIFLISEGGQEDPMVTRLLDRYQDQSVRVEVKKIDPVLYPGFVAGYTEERLSNNSIIVEAEGKSRIIHAKDLYSIGTSAMTGRKIETGFDGEGLVTGAITYVASDQRPVMYMPDANGEIQLPEKFLDEADKNNIELRSLNLLVQEHVPEDADALLILAPATDYSEETAGKILSFLEAGGKALIYSNYSLQPMPVLDRILADYGLAREEGIVLEGDTSSFISYPYCLVPAVMYTEATADVYRDYYVLMPMAQAIRVRDSYRNTIFMQPLLMSSKMSYNKADVQNMTTSEQEEGDKSGPFILGMEVQEDIDGNGQNDTEILYYSTGYLLDKDYDQTVSGGNARLFGNALRILAGTVESQVSIPDKSMQAPVLTLTDRAANIWTVLCVFVLPGLFMITGTVIWAVRRRA